MAPDTNFGATFDCGWCPRKRATAWTQPTASSRSLRERAAKTTPALGVPRSIKDRSWATDRQPEARIKYCETATSGSGSTSAFQFSGVISTTWGSLDRGGVLGNETSAWHTAGRLGCLRLFGVSGKGWKTPEGALCRVRAPLLCLSRFGDDPIRAARVRRTRRALGPRRSVCSPLDPGLRGHFKPG